MFYFLYRVDSLRLLSTELKNNKLRIKETPWTTIRGAFTRFSSMTFKELFTKLLGSLSFVRIPEIDLLGKLCVIDGSKFDISVRADWAEYKSTKNGIKLHLLLGLNEMVIQSFKITKAVESEIKMLKDMIQYGVTYIADRGYVSFDLFNSFCEKSAYFVIRIRNNMNYNTHIFSDYQCYAFGKVKDVLIIFKNDPHQQYYRVVSFKFGGKHYQLLTNRLDLTTEEVIFIYACRWQIELLFNYLKNSINGSHLLNESENGLYIQFYIIAIVQLLLLNLKQECCKIAYGNDNTRISFSIEQLLSNPISSISERLKCDWKIGIHFLKYLKNVLDKPLSEGIAKELAAM